MPYTDLILYAKIAFDILIGRYIDQARITMSSSDRRDQEEYKRAYTAIKIYIKAERNLNASSS